ncbi:MEDS domain-containing protein [Methanosarcina horonobensis]|uniref:MEDS domain-containing protein n=1 Tax=Methanosarcina horonobensis TaxID=418008 RepID=UPI000AF7EFB2|nr:MEDS domain-containing protein [Methanosarcina horonobensis]
MITTWKKRQIEFISYANWFLKEGTFDSKRTLNCWIEKLNQALTSGYDGLRVAEDTNWLEKESWDDFVDYEEKLDSLTNGCQMLILCTYCQDICSVTETIDVISNHQMSLIKKKGKWEKNRESHAKEYYRPETGRKYNL